MQTIYWSFNATVCWDGNNIVPTATNAINQFWAKNLNQPCNTAFVMFATGSVIHNFFCFNKYTPVNWFNDFVQSALDARRQGDKNLKSRVSRETMTQLADNSYPHKSWTVVVILLQTTWMFRGRTRYAAFIVKRTWYYIIWNLIVFLRVENNINNW